MKKILIICLFLLLTNVYSFAGERINVAFCIDNNYPLYTMLTINSILLNNKSNSDYTFYIINNNLSFFNKLRMKIYVTLRKQKIEFINIDTTVIDNGKEIFADTETSYITRIGNARILLPEVLPNDIDKILYLDSDLIVLSDLKELYDTPIDDYYAGMVLNHTLFNDDLKETEGIKKNGYYYNSGVILMNLPLWKQNNISKKLVDCIKRNKLEFIDQDAINIVLRKHIKTLPYKYNNQIFLRVINQEELAEILAQSKRITVNDIKVKGKILIPISETCILHFITKQKPWIFYKDFSAYEYYYDYWGKSGLLFERLIMIFSFYYTQSTFKRLVDSITIS